MQQVMRQKVEEEGSQSLLEPVTGSMICDAVARQMQVLGFLLCSAPLLSCLVHSEIANTIMSTSSCYQFRKYEHLPTSCGF